MGLPKNIKDDDVHCEFPVDADDEYVTERGFQPTLPGESTKLSSALALFRASRILSKVLEEVFPAKTSYDLSLKTLSDLSDELDSWHSTLPQHLRLPFAQDKPTVGTISSRSPILSMAYHYIRALIQRPAVCASLGSKSSSAMLALASSCKSVVQIVQLLEERSLSFSFCLNKDEVLVLSGFGLLFQRLTLDPSSKILKEGQKIVTSVMDLLNKSDAPCAPEFKKVVDSFIPSGEQVAAPKPANRQSSPKGKTSRHNSEGSLPAPRPQTLQSSTKKQLKALASRFNPSIAPTPTDNNTQDRRATVPNLGPYLKTNQAQSQPSLSPQQQTYEPVNISRSEPALSPSNISTRPASTTVHPSAPPHHQHPHLKPKKRSAHPQPNLTNLDYLSFAADPSSSHATPSATTHPIKPEPQPTDWEKLLGSLDGSTTNIFDACYGGQPIEGLLDSYPAPHPHRASTSALPTASASALDWNPDLWSLYQGQTTAQPLPTGLPDRQAQPGSIWSYDSASTADERGRSAEDLTLGVWGDGSGVVAGQEANAFPGIVMPELGLGAGAGSGSGSGGGSGSEEFQFPFAEWGDVGA